MIVKTSTVRSAGGVVIRNSRRGPEVLLIATHGAQRWSLPKGRIEPGEDARTAALREVAEETGIKARIVAPLETIEYWFYAHRHLRLHKFVEYFLMQYEGGHLLPQLNEVDAVVWIPLAEAYHQVTYPNAQRLIEMAQQQWSQAKSRRRKGRGRKKTSRSKK